MADIYGSHFEFGGISSRQWGLVFANVDTNRVVQLSGPKEGVTVFSKKAVKRYLIDDDYSASPLSFEVEIISESDSCLLKETRRSIEKWLFNHRDYRKLYLDIDDDPTGESFEYIDGEIKRNYLNCRFLNPEKIEGNGGIIGYRATLEADSNMFWQDAVVKQYSIGNSAEDSVSNITVLLDTDLDEYTYPKVTIKVGSVGGNISIFNNNDDISRHTRFVNMSPNVSLTLNGEINHVTNPYYQNFADQNFPRLLDGNNVFTVSGNVEMITFEYSARRVL